MLWNGPEPSRSAMPRNNSFIDWEAKRRCLIRSLSLPSFVIAPDYLSPVQGATLHICRASGLQPSRMTAQLVDGRQWASSCEPAHA
jgi:hypothetical protein